MSHRPDHQVDNLVKRINRIEGQIGGIKKMIVDEKPFDEVIIQLNSAKAAIQNITRSTCRSYLYRCCGKREDRTGVGKFKAGDSSIQQDAISEVIRCLHSKKIKF